jgi:protein translocase SecG subunit
VAVAYNITLGISLLIAVAFSLLVLVTGKGDAMSGGGGIRTTFRGKAGFEDFLSRLILGLGASFMALMILLDWMGRMLPKK